MASPEYVDVFVRGQEGYHTYRIPALIVSAKGTLLAFCEGRKRSAADHGDIDLMLRRSTDGGRTWGPLQLVYEEGGDAEITIGNPCPVLDRHTGILWLPFCRDNRHVLVTHSTDDGQTWAEPVDITPAVKDPHWWWVATGPGVGIQMRDGRLVVPGDRKYDGDGQTCYYSHILYSDDHGATWHLGGAAGPGCGESQVVELADGSLMLNMRNVGTPHKERAVALSRDGGLSWSEVWHDPALIEPQCQASLLRYTQPPQPGDGRLLFSNPASQERRVRMTVRLSPDEGRTWPIAKVLHEGPAAYSCLAVLPDGDIGCLYECGERSSIERITFAHFPLQWLEG